MAEAKENKTSGAKEEGKKKPEKGKWRKRNSGKEERGYLIIIEGEIYLGK